MEEVEKLAREVASSSETLCRGGRLISIINCCPSSYQCPIRDIVIEALSLPRDIVDMCSGAEKTLVTSAVDKNKIVITSVKPCFRDIAFCILSRRCRVSLSLSEEEKQKMISAKVEKAKKIAQHIEKIFGEHNVISILSERLLKPCLVVVLYREDDKTVRKKMFRGYIFPEAKILNIFEEVTNDRS